MAPSGPGPGTRASVGVGAWLLLLAVVLLLAGAAFLLFWQEEKPGVARLASRDDAPERDARADRAEPVAADRSAEGGGPSERSRPPRPEGGARATAAATRPPAAAPSDAARRRISGVLVDEHARPISEESLRAAVVGELPRVWFTQAGRRLAEFALLPDGNLFVDVVPPVDRTELRAEVTLAGRTFATFLDHELREPFSLRVELSALPLDTSAATIVVRPPPATEELSDRYVVLFREAERRATWIDATGLARFPTLREGTWEGIVCVSGEQPIEFEFTLGERDDRDVLVELRPGFRIRGEAAWSDLVAPLPPCVVVATRLDGAEPDPDARRERLQGGVVPLGGDGSFELGPLPAATWRLELLRIDREPQTLHEEVVITGRRDVETVAWRITPPQPPARVVRFLFAWPGELPPEPTGNIVIPRALVVTFFGAGAAVVGRGLLDPAASAPPQLPLPEGATVVELAWRDLADGRLLDSGVAVTRVALPKVVQSGATRDLKVTFAAVPRD